MSSTIAILGCGWLGLPLAGEFVASGCRVHGSTTSEDKKQLLANAGITPFVISLNEDGIEGPVDRFLHGATELLINVPPGIRSGSNENYVLKMEQLYRALKTSKVRKVIFVSSTSVYGAAKGLVTEATPPAPGTESGRQLLEAEHLFQNDRELQTIIVRFGGLIGAGRHPVTFLSGKTGLSNGDDPVNLIHLEDCIHMLKTVISEGHWDKIFNGVYPAHPIKRDYYTEEARKRNLTVPDYGASGGRSKEKIVTSANFLSNNYSFFTSIFS